MSFSSSILFFKDSLLMDYWFCIFIFFLLIDHLVDEGLKADFLETRHILASTSIYNIISFIHSFLCIEQSTNI